MGGGRDDLGRTWMAHPQFLMYLNYYKIVVIFLKYIYKNYFVYAIS